MGSFDDLTKYLSGYGDTAIGGGDPTENALATAKRLSPRKTGYAAADPAARRPTAAPTAAAAAPATAATSAPPSTPPDDPVARTSQNLDNINAQLLAAPSPKPPAAYQADTGKRGQLTQEETQLAAPLNRADYKPKWWQRVAGMGIGAALGAAGAPSAGAQLGGSVINHDYNRAEAMREKQHAAKDEEIQQFDKTTAAGQRNYENQVQSFGEQISGNNELRNRADEQRKQLDTQDKMVSYQNSPAANARPFLDKDANGNQTLMVKTRGGKKIPYTPRSLNEGSTLEIANGLKDGPFSQMLIKLRPQRAERTGSASARQYEDWKDAFIEQNEREPNADEISNYRRGTPAKPNPGASKEARTAETAKNQQWDDENRAFNKSLAELQKTQSDPEKRRNAELQMKQDHNQRLQDIQNNFEGSLQQLQVGVDHYDVGSGKKDSERATAGSAIAQQPQQQLTPTSIAKPPKPGTKLDINKPEHQLIATKYFKAAGGDKAKARQMAQSDGWKF